MIRTLSFSLSLLLLLASVPARAAVLDPAITAAALDLPACRVLHADGAEPLEPAALRELLGLDGSNAHALAAGEKLNLPLGTHLAS